MDSRREEQNVQKHRALEQYVVSKEDAGRACSVWGPAVVAGHKAGDRKGRQVAHTRSPAKDLGPKHKVNHACAQMDNSGMIRGKRKDQL